MAEWSKDHVATIGYLNLTLVRWLNWRPDEALRWKGQTIGCEGQGEVCEKPVPLRL
jgi:hypothetical protein